MQDIFKKALCLHNLYRKNHDAPPLIWDDKIAEIAQEHADYLAESNTFQHGHLYDKDGNRLGQNIATVVSMKMALEDRIEDAVIRWYKEVSLYNFSKQGFSMETGHFTQVVWKSTTKIGIGVATKNNRTVIVADYSPPGNVFSLYEKNVSPCIVIPSSNPIPIPNQISSNHSEKNQMITIKDIHSTLDSFSRKDGLGQYIFSLYQQQPITLMSYKIIPKERLIEEFPSCFRIEGSENGVSWTIIDEQKDIKPQSHIFVISKPHSYSYVRMIITRSTFKEGYGWGRIVNIKEMNLYHL